MADDPIKAALDLLERGASRAATQVLRNALHQREARLQRQAWTPGGVVPLKPRPANSNEPDLPPSIA